VLNRLVGLAVVWSILAGGALGAGWLTRLAVAWARRTASGPHEDMAAAVAAALLVPSFMVLGFRVLDRFARPLRGDQDLWSWMVRLHFPRA